MKEKFSASSLAIFLLTMLSLNNIGNTDRSLLGVSDARLT